MSENGVVLCITANTVLNLASRAREIFESSEVSEKRQLLNLMFQNLQLRDVNLSVQVTEPFKTMVDYKECPTNWRWRESNSRAKPLRRLMTTCLSYV